MGDWGNELSLKMERVVVSFLSKTTVQGVFDVDERGVMHGSWSDEDMIQIRIAWSMWAKQGRRESCGVVQES